MHGEQETIGRQVMTGQSHSHCSGFAARQNKSSQSYKFSNVDQQTQKCF